MRTSRVFREVEPVRGMSVGLRLLGATMGVLVLTTRLAAAQTLPVPTLPPERTPEPEAGPQPDGPASQAEAVDVPAPARPRAWEYALGAGVGWESNIDFQVPDGPSGVVLVPQGGLARVFWSPRGQLRATVAGRASGYPDLEQIRRYYDLGLDGSYRSSPSTRWRASTSYELGHSDSSRILVDQGVSLPVVETRSLAATAGVSKDSTRTTLLVDGRFYSAEFDSGGLINGQSLRGTVGLERRIGSRTTAAIVYALEDVLSDQAGRSYLTHFGSIQWSRVLSLRSALLLEGGASYTPDPVRAGIEQKENFFGGASFSRQMRRSHLTLFVRRELIPAFGIGVSRLALRAGLNANVPIGRVWEIRTIASHVQPESPSRAEAVYGSSDAFVVLSRRLGRHFEVSSQARYRRRGGTPTDQTIEAFDAGLFLTLLTASGRATVPPPGR